MDRQCRQVRGHGRTQEAGVRSLPVKAIVVVDGVAAVDIDDSSVVAAADSCLRHKWR